MPYFIAANESGEITAVHFRPQDRAPKSRPIRVPKGQESLVKPTPPRAWYDHDRGVLVEKKFVELKVRKREFLADGQDAGIVVAGDGSVPVQVRIHQNRKVWKTQIPEGETLEVTTFSPTPIVVVVDDVEYEQHRVTLMPEEVDDENRPG